MNITCLIIAVVALFAAEGLAYYRIMKVCTEYWGLSDDSWEGHPTRRQANRPFGALRMWFSGFKHEWLEYKRAPNSWI